MRAQCKDSPNEQRVMDIVPCGIVMILIGLCCQDFDKGNTILNHAVQTK